MDGTKPESPRMQAARAGSPTFIAATPCRVCGGVERYTSSTSCVQCTRRKAREAHERVKAARAEASANG